jgi:Flp pilus assembly protein TadD
MPGNFSGEINSLIIMDAALRREVKNLLRMGESALERKDYDQASFLFRKAFTQDPDNIAAIINLGYTYVRMGRFSHARKCFTTALDIDPENPVARKNCPSHAAGKKQTNTVQNTGPDLKRIFTSGTCNGAIF